MSEWMGRGTQSTPCVCGVSSAICVCGRVGLGAGERREATSVDSVGGGCGGQAPSTAPHQRACHHSAPLCPVPPPTHTHTADRAGQRTQWWWLVGMAHSGGGSHTTHSHHHHVPHTPCVCVMGVDSTSTASECTKWSHCPQHPRCHHQHQQEQEERGVGWWSGAEGVGMGVGGWVGAHTGKSVGTHQPPKCEWRGVEPWLCVWQKECAHPHHHHHHQQEEDKGGQGQKGQGLVGQKEGGRGTNTTTHHKQARKHNGGVTNNNTHTKPQEQEEEEEERTEREVEARGRKGGAASTRHSECVGGVWHTRGTNHTPHPLNTQRERETGKGKGQEKRQRKTKDKEWCMGVVVMEKQEASKLVTHHHFAPHFFPTPFFSLPPFLPLPFFPFSKLRT